jgi:microcystin-dependent protein
MFNKIVTSCLLAATIAATPVSSVLAGPDPYIGEIRFVPFNFAPAGWAFCDGQLLAISQYSALFALLGTTYGGNGQTTFALPDMRGRVLIHRNNGPELTPYNLGETGGSERHTDNDSHATTGTGHNHSLIERNIVDRDTSKIQPYITLNCIIAIHGVFPPRP